MIPTEASLVADNRQLAGPFADLPALEGLCTRLIRKEPDDATLYKQRANLRARYLQKWSLAADDLAKVIELAPDDLWSWHHRTMLLAKLQRKDLLAEHLAKMLARFQGKSVGVDLIHSLTTFPIERPELLQAAELLAGKLPNDPESRFWEAIARYRAGKYEEADRLLSASANQRPYFRTFHAMIKAKVHDRENAKELLSEARAALNKEIRDNHGAEQGDYGDYWWDRLSDEALLAEAEAVIAGAMSEDDKLPRSRPAAASKGVPGRQNPLLPKIVFGEWFPLLPPRGQLLGCDGLNDQVRYSSPALEMPEKGWTRLLATPNQLVGWGNSWGNARYFNRNIETRDGGIGYQVIVKDVSLRTRAKKGWGQNIAIALRTSTRGDYIAWFNGGRSFGIGKHVYQKYGDLAAVEAPESNDGFFDFEFSAVGNALTLTVNGFNRCFIFTIRLIRSAPSTFRQSEAAYSRTLRSGYRPRNHWLPIIACWLVPLRGPARIGGTMRRRLLTKEPDNLGLYRLRAEFRARYMQKWSHAAEDLAKVIELKPDDLPAWCDRTMLLGKLQRKDLLAEHLAKMLAKFQDGGQEGKVRLIHSLTAFPIERPELVQAAELLADKFSDRPESPFWVAIARYRAGKYEEADKLFSAAAGAGVNQRPCIRMFHAMIKAKVHDRAKAKELLSDARAALKKEVLDDHGTERVGTTGFTGGTD